ncbi:Fe-S cluster assembly protein SufD [Limoniibacter endophyticus]|uniref:Fe-S cluster assembly protein SufD n=1 Tax=Limoniibacter endophyticus TaxID=1565040 RepID=A0A8J3GFG1_9HYPH|nr:Fe-S cluster assembly protein SufD [Limoniibacter endophyticus]GHC62557.1 Fe-S cluster assembly protein SufD [Limoniibacter endophyticus]
MNLHANPPQRTAAETALVEAYGERLSTLAGDSAVLANRDTAIEMLKRGLPTKRIEAWHYTDLRRLLTTLPSAQPSANAKTLAPLLADSDVLVMENGVASNAAAIEGLTIARFEKSLLDGTAAAALVPAADDDAVGAINAAFVGDGYMLSIEGEHEKPVELQNLHGGGQVFARFVVDVKPGAKTTIVERQAGTERAFVSSVTDLVIEDDAEVLYIVLQDQTADSTYLAQFNAKLGKNAKLTLFFMNEGGKLVRQEVRVIAEGEGADFQMRGVNLLAGDTHTDVTMVLDHAVPETTSTEIVRNVVTGKASGVFQGRINVHQVAQKTDARMACNTLLLSDDADFSAKPELEIFADDVACGHGATVTEINPDHLFYLMARGVDEKTARGLLVRAFLAEVIEELEDEAIVEALERRLSDWFVNHG